MVKNNISEVVLLVCSVILLSVSQPSLFFEDGLSFCAWICYIPVFLLAERVSLKKSYLYGFLYGSLSYLCMCWWLSSFGVAAISFVCLLFGFYNSIVFFLLCLSKHIFPKKQKSFFWIFRAALVISAEYGRTHGVFAFSYGIIGYSQWKNPVLLKFSSLFGVMGVSFVILLANSLIAKIIHEKNLKRNFRAVSICISFIFGIYLYWFIPLFFPKNQASEVLNVVLIQNSSSAHSDSISDYIKDAATLKSLTDKALRLYPETELVVWGETAVVPDIIYHLKNKSDPERHSLAVDLNSYFRSKECSFLIGNNHIDVDGTHNAALYFSHISNNEVGVYNKNHLVPFTEFWPDFLDFKMFDGIKDSLNCEYFAKGNGFKLFSIENSAGSKLNFSVPICFEDSFANIAAEMKKNGADFFVNISDDAWSGSEAARNMHLSMSAFRCAEFSSPMIRSTIDGKTCALDSCGKVISVIDSGCDSFLCTKMYVHKKSRTFYLFAGDLPVQILCCLVIVLLLILSARFAKVILYGRRKAEKKSYSFWSGN